MVGIGPAIHDGRASGEFLVGNAGRPAIPKPQGPTRAIDAIGGGITNQIGGGRNRGIGIVRDIHINQAVFDGHQFELPPVGFSFSRPALLLGAIPGRSLPILAFLGQFRDRARPNLGILKLKRFPGLRPQGSPCSGKKEQNDKKEPNLR
jgi:hypothetical protein